MLIYPSSPSTHPSSFISYFTKNPTPQLLSDSLEEYCYYKFIYFLFTEIAYLCKVLLILEFEQQQKKGVKFSSVFLLAFLIVI